MSNVLGYVPNDGYSEQGIIMPIAGLYPRLEFEFRPMLMEQRQEYFKAADKLLGMQLRRLAGGYLLKQVKSWDLKGRDGNIVPITVVNLMLLKEPLFNRLFAIVSTDAPSDIDPNRTEPEKDEDLTDALTAAEKGITVGEAREAREAKNSPAQSHSS